MVEEAVKGIVLENGYLVFKDDKHYRDVVEKIGKMTNTQLGDFGKRLNFNSKRRTIDAALKALVALKDNQILSEEFKRELKFSADGSYRGTVFPFFNRSVILNDKGIVKVGKEIYVFTNEQFIAIKDGDMSKIDMALRLTESSIKDNIFVSRFHSSSSQPNLAQSRYSTSGSGTVWSNTLVTGNFPFRNAYRCYIDYTWFITEEVQGFPNPPYVFKDFEFNVTAMSLIVFYNRPYGNTSETGLTLLPVRGNILLFSGAEAEGLPQLSDYFAYNYPIQSNSWLLNFTPISGSRFKSRYNAKFGQFRIEGGFHANSYSISPYVFYLTDGNWIQID